jgi:hypothetical protein
VRQSDSRVPGRPPSFGRAESEGLPVEDMTVRGGQALHLVLHLDVTPSQQSLDKLHEAIAATTKDAVLMVTKWMCVAEVVDSDCERALESFTSPDFRAWDTLGMLGYLDARERGAVGAELGD